LFSLLLLKEDALMDGRANGQGISCYGRALWNVSQLLSVIIIEGYHQTPMSELGRLHAAIPPSIPSDHLHHSRQSQDPYKRLQVPIHRSLLAGINPPFGSATSKVNYA
jgi:hypothetical protein